jgi:septum formation protein
MFQKLRFKFILASSSRFRLDLLKQIGVIPDEILSPDIDESCLKGESPRVYSERMAIEKARKISDSRKGCLILSADTVISVGTRVLHKPNNIDEARKHLNLLSGRQHRCYTTICLISPSATHVKTNLTMVKFKRLHKDEIDFYLQTKEWEGCAGGYTISGYAGGFIKSINGSYSAVCGLPLYEVRQMLLNY